MFVDYADVKAAIESDQVVPFFQPIVDLRARQVVGFEVLARWNHPLHGPLLPNNFISIAEKSGLIGQLTEQVLRKAFAASPLIPEPLVLAVNVSPAQLHDSSLPRQIADLAAGAGFLLSRLTIEITESALFEDLGLVRKIAGEFKAMGCSLALDDFGTGFSSLRHLQALPFDVLKIDRHFVESMANTRASRKIVAAIIGLGHSLDLITIAEGIETEAQAKMLLCLGCTLGQGWLYGKPTAANAISDVKIAPAHVGPVGLPRKGDTPVASSLEAMPTLRLAQLQAIYDGAPVGLCFLDRNLRYMSINRRLAKMNGLPMDSHLGRCGKELFPGWFPSYEPYLRRALQGEAIAGVEIFRPATMAAPEMTVMVSYQPAWDEAKEVIGVSVAVTDITVRKAAQESQRESENNQRYFFELNSQVQWIMDPAGNNIDVSSRWEKTTGLSKEETRNFGWLNALHPADVDPTMKALRGALSTGHNIDMEYRVKSVDSGWRWMRSQGSPCYGPSGEIIRWYGSVEDIQDNRQTDRTMRNRRTDFPILEEVMVASKR